MAEQEAVHVRDERRSLSASGDVPRAEGAHGRDARPLRDDRGVADLDRPGHAAVVADRVPHRLAVRSDEADLLGAQAGVGHELERRPREDLPELDVEQAERLHVAVLRRDRVDAPLQVGGQRVGPAGEHALLEVGRGAGQLDQDGFDRVRARARDHAEDAHRQPATWRSGEAGTTAGIGAEDRA